MNRMFSATVALATALILIGGVLTSCDADAAWGDTATAAEGAGSGTADDPYRGTVKVDLSGLASAEIYVKVGTNLSVVVDCVGGFSDLESGSDDIGLSQVSQELYSGTITEAGVATI